MADEITPALTPEAWADLLRGVELRFDEDGELTNDSRAAYGHGVTAEMHDGEIRLRATHCWCDIESGSYHVVAALALYQQKFGFSREDVTALRDVARELDVAGFFEHDRDARRGNNMQALAGSLARIADKVAALLPPEDANG